MPTIRQSAKTVSEFDVKKLATELGANVKEATVTAARGRYYVAVGGTKAEIPIGGLNSTADVRKMLGQIVPAVVVGRTIVAVGLPYIHRPACYYLCYLPVPDLLKRIQPEIRAALIKQYVANGTITSGMASRLQ